MKVILVTLWLSLIVANFDLQAQKRDSLYWPAYACLYKLIDSAFENRTDTSVIVEQSALVQFQLTDGRIDTFYIWSTHDKKVSDWLIPFLKPAIGRRFEGYKPFRYVLFPVNVLDTRKHRTKFPSDYNFTGDFIRAFKHAYNGNVTITQGILLEPMWVIECKKMGNITPVPTGKLDL